MPRSLGPVGTGPVTGGVPVAVAARVILALGFALGFAAPPVLAAGGMQQPGTDRTDQIEEAVVAVSGTNVRALCTPGPRRVILLHDEIGTADDWVPVLARLDGRVGACAYDRAGTGGSGPAPSVRGWYELEDELRMIHGALGFEPGYVLVGHGLGGLYARLFAMDRAADVGGLILLEPAHEDLPSRSRVGIPNDVWEAWMAQRALPNADGVRESTVGERARGRRLPAIPVVVVTAGLRPSATGWNERFLAEAARRVHASILRGVPSARHVPAERSGRAIPLEAPDLVVTEVMRVVRSINRVAGRNPERRPGLGNDRAGSGISRPNEDGS